MGERLGTGDGLEVLGMAVTRVKWPALTVLEGLGLTAYRRGEWAGRSWRLEVQGGEILHLIPRKARSTVLPTWPS